MASSKNSLITMKFEGADDLEAALRALGNNSAIRKALTTAMMDAAQPMAQDARSRARARRKSGRLDEGIDVSTTLSRRQRHPTGNNATSTTVYVGAGPTQDAVLEEFGTTLRNWKSGKSTGSEPANPFMRPAWEAHKQQILDDFGKYLWVTIEAEAKRLARKQATLIAKAGGS